MKKKVFILEDSPVVAELLKFQIELDLDAEVTCFTSGNELLKNLLIQPDLIILDYYLGNWQGANGLTILKKIKTINSKIPVIVFSGQHNLKTAIQLINAGASDYVDKNSESFHEEIITGIRGIFEFEDFEQKIEETKRKLLIDTRQLFVIGVLGALFTIALFYAS